MGHRWGGRGFASEREADEAEARVTRVATIFVVLGCVGLVWLAAHVPDTGGEVHMPQRSEQEDGGPTSSTVVPTSAPAPPAPQSTVPTTPAETVDSTAPTTAPVTTIPVNGDGNGNRNGRPGHTSRTRPTPSWPPTSDADG